MLFALLRDHTNGPSALPLFITPPPPTSYLMFVRNAAFSDAFQLSCRLVLLVHAHRHVWFLLLSMQLSKTSSRTCMNISMATEVRFLHRCLANGSWSGTLERGEQGPIFKVFSRHPATSATLMPQRAFWVKTGELPGWYPLMKLSVMSRGDDWGEYNSSNARIKPNHVYIFDIALLLLNGNSMLK